MIYSNIHNAEFGNKNPKEIDRDFNNSMRIISNAIGSPSTSKVNGYILSAYLTILIARYLERKIEFTINDEINNSFSKIFDK